MDQALETLSASRGSLSRAVESMPTPVLLILFFSVIIILQCLSASPSDDLLPVHECRLISLPGVTKKGHAYLDVGTRQLVFSEQKLDAYERREERREQRKLRKYYRLREALREYRKVSRRIPEHPEEVLEVV
ncbi:hypothetical protein A1Q2_00923 [Trichosporon asahii var. asahii CBS 8904]|uniref:Uncharacterized protein n=1 Tax=Trichosporon asahii var. asahii (strain CBS 8904) TaxID=1220162 RepID=K1W744_TRIAC|nr:hypothetical protein A1Q2_00923 [Trichosporon asahii var. asahii CBS 8904]